MKRKFGGCRKYLSVLLILSLCACMLLTGCGGKEQQTVEEEPEEEVVKYDDIAGVYRAEIFMTEDQSVLLYLQISEDGSFVFARDDQFEKTEKGAGYLGKTEEDEDAFFYETLNGSQVDASEYTATYMVDVDGNIQFTSQMWFGSTSPKIVNEDESVTYPCFINVEALPEEEEEEEQQEEEVEEPEDVEEEQQEEQEDAQEADAPETKPSNAAAEAPAAPAAAEPAAAEPAAPEPAPEPEPEPAPPQPTLAEGTYRGSLEKYVDAMDSTIHYDVTVTFQGGSYSYTVNITLSGSMEYSGQESYSGSYSVNGSSLSMTGSLSSGSISGSSVTVTGQLSSFAGGQESVTVYQ